MKKVNVFIYGNLLIYSKIGGGNFVGYADPKDYDLSCSTIIHGNVTIDGSLLCNGTVACTGGITCNVGGHYE